MNQVSDIWNTTRLFFSRSCVHWTLLVVCAHMSKRFTYTVPHSRCCWIHCRGCTCPHWIYDLFCLTACSVARLLWRLS